MKSGVINKLTQDFKLLKMTNLSTQIIYYTYKLSILIQIYVNESRCFKLFIYIYFFYVNILKYKISIQNNEYFNSLQHLD